MQVKNPHRRYARQIKLPLLGEAGQDKLNKASVLVVGAGGLGCPVLLYLVSAGVGTIGIVDDDIVSLSNLHRQVLYREEDIGSYKVEKAAEYLKKLNGEIRINSYQTRLTNRNALDILSDYDIIVDGTDNMVSRYVINDACVLMKKPFVYGAISRFEGQVAVFNLNTDNNSRAATYRDLFPLKPGSREVMNCEESGVIGVLPGIIGTWQAAEVIKLITGIGKPVANLIINYNMLSNKSYSIELQAGADTLSDIPTSMEEFEQMEYEHLCSATLNKDIEIDFNTLSELMTNTEPELIDVRDYGEQPEFQGINHVKIPLDKLKERVFELKGDKIILFCKTGARSLQGAKMLREMLGNDRMIYSLRENISDIQNYFKAKVNE